MVSLLVAQGHIGGDACQPLFKASRVAQLIHFGKGQQESIVSQFFSHLAVTHDALAYHRHSLVICPVQASECRLVALYAPCHKLLYVHQKRIVSMNIDTTLPKRLHVNHNFFCFFTLNERDKSPNGFILFFLIKQ